MFELVYCNGGTPKVRVRLFEEPDHFAERGVEEAIAWYRKGEDNNIQEIGEEFSKNLEHASFDLTVVPAN